MTNIINWLMVGIVIFIGLISITLSVRHIVRYIKSGDWKK
jgi:hypothetical protein